MEGRAGERGRDGRSGWRVKDGERRRGESTTEPGCQARTSSPVHTSAEMSFLLQTGCNADSPGCTQMTSCKSSMSSLPDRLMHWARQARGGGVPGLHLLIYDHKMFSL